MANFFSIFSAPIPTKIQEPLTLSPPTAPAAILIKTNDEEEPATLLIKTNDEEDEEFIYEETTNDMRGENQLFSISSPSILPSTYSSFHVPPIPLNKLPTKDVRTAKTQFVSEILFNCF